MNRAEEAEQHAALLPVLEARLRVFEQGKIYRSGVSDGRRRIEGNEARSQRPGTEMRSTRG